MDDDVATITIVDGPVLGGPTPRPVLVDYRGPVANEDGDRNAVVAPNVVGDVILFGGLNVMPRASWTRIAPRLDARIKAGDIVVLDKMPARKHERIDLAERSRGALGLAAVLVAEDGRAIMRSEVCAALAISARKGLAPKEAERFAAIERRVIRDTKHDDAYDLCPDDMLKLPRDQIADDALSLIKSALA